MALALGLRPANALRDGLIHRRNLGERRREDAIALVLDAIPTEVVWTTIDKDVLPEALANWGQGHISLQALQAMLRAADAAQAGSGRRHLRRIFAALARQLVEAHRGFAWTNRRVR